MTDTSIVGFEIPCFCLFLLLFGVILETVLIKTVLSGDSLYIQTEKQVDS